MCGFWGTLWWIINSNCKTRITWQGTSPFPPSFSPDKPFVCEKDYNSSESKYKILLLLYPWRCEFLKQIMMVEEKQKEMTTGAWNGKRDNIVDEELGSLLEILLSINNGSHFHHNYLVSFPNNYGVLLSNSRFAILIIFRVCTKSTFF